MTFSAYEISARGGKPTQLFVFGRQSLVWRFCNADRDLTIGGNTYTAVAISRSEIKQTVEKAQDNITITLPYALDPNATELPATQALGDNWRPFVPTDPITVMCMATHLDDPDRELAVQWLGVVQQPKFIGNAGTLELTCVPPGQIGAARYQGAKWQVACWKTVYGTGLRGCNLTSAPIAVAGTVTAIAGSMVTANAYLQQQRSFVGGTAAWTALPPHAGNVTALTGSDATLDDVTDIIVGTAINWTGGSGHVTAIAGSVVTLDSVTGLTSTSAVTWVGSVAQAYTANITAADSTAKTITLDNTTGIAVGTVVTAYTLGLETAATLTAVAGLVLTAAAFATAALNLAGGELWWTQASTGLLLRRSIIAHSGSAITLTYGAADIAVGLAVTARPGCGRTWDDCAARGNTVNYGGAIYKPIHNPYDSQSMSWGNS